MSRSISCHFTWKGAERIQIGLGLKDIMSLGRFDLHEIETQIDHDLYGVTQIILFSVEREGEKGGICRKKCIHIYRCMYE